MSSTATYEQLQTSNLVTFHYDAITSNFKTIDSFIQNFPHFQRKLIDMEKMTKATAHDLSNFKMSTSNTFSTMNEVLDSRGNITKGNNKAVEQEMAKVKEEMKGLKVFVTEATRDLNQHFEENEKTAAQTKKQLEDRLDELATHHQSSKLRIEALEDEVVGIKQRYSTKTESENIRTDLREAKAFLKETRDKLQETTDLLNRLGVKQFKTHLDAIELELRTDMTDLKAKFKLKTDVTDTLKLEDMLLNMINLSYENIFKKFAGKGETKKALMFLEKKINALIQGMYPEEEERQGLVVTKGAQCISCSKDFGQHYDGNTNERNKVWSGLPAKEMPNKQRYAGFGNGFQSIIETAVSKKGGDIGYDEKGRMTTPFNLSRESHPSLLKQSQSQSKMSKGSPHKGPSESNFMNLFGRSSEVDVDLRAEYLQKERGLMSTIKKALQQNR